MTTTPIRIDFVSDVSCPWCAIGLNSLEVALGRLGESVQAQIHFQPFELNPHMVPEGQDITEHLRQKYGASPAQQEQTREMIRQRGADVGFDFAMGMRSRIYNTFDAHRLLHWAGEHGKQKELKKALFDAYFTRGQDQARAPCWCNWRARSAWTRRRQCKCCHLAATRRKFAIWSISTTATASSRCRPSSSMKSISSPAGSRRKPLSEPCGK